MATDINSYRFGRGEEPTDEMLQQIMSEVTATAIEKHKKKRPRNILLKCLNMPGSKKLVGLNNLKHYAMPNENIHN